MEQARQTAGPCIHLPHEEKDTARPTGGQTRVLSPFWAVRVGAGTWRAGGGRSALAEGCAANRTNRTGGKRRTGIGRKGNHLAGTVCGAGGGEQDMTGAPWSKFPGLEWPPELLPWPAPHPASCFPKCLTAASPRGPPGSVAETG